MQARQHDALDRGSKEGYPVESHSAPSDADDRACDFCTRTTGLKRCDDCGAVICPDCASTGYGPRLCPDCEATLDALNAGAIR